MLLFWIFYTNAAESHIKRKFTFQRFWDLLWVWSLSLWRGGLHWACVAWCWIVIIIISLFLDIMQEWLLLGGNFQLRFCPLSLLYRCFSKVITDLSFCMVILYTNWEERIHEGCKANNVEGLRDEWTTAKQWNVRGPIYFTQEKHNNNKNNISRFCARRNHGALTILSASAVLFVLILRQ